jgi:hypothetical protein
MKKINPAVIISLSSTYSTTQRAYSPGVNINVKASPNGTTRQAIATVLIEKYFSSTPGLLTHVIVTKKSHRQSRWFFL